MIIGIDIGGTKIELSLFDRQLNTLGSWRVSTPTEQYRGLLDDVISLVERAEKLGGPVDAIGVGVPGLVLGGKISATSNIPNLEGKSLGADLSKTLERKVSIANDANTFVESEAFDGSGAESRSIWGLILGTGYSGAFVCSGHLNNGSQGVAGEIGHVPIAASLVEAYGLPLRRCGCGLSGCIETYVSGKALSWLCRYLKTPFESSIELSAALDSKEPAAEKVIEIYIDCLSSSIASLVLINDPEVVVLGGGVSNLSCLYERLPAAVERYLFAGLSVPPIEKARHGDSSGVRGAALMALREITVQG